MAKKRGGSKKISRSAKKIVAKSSGRTSKISSKPELKNMDSKLRKSNRFLLYSLAVFVVSLVLYLVTYNFLESLFGFIAVISGALVFLFLIISLILYLIKKRN